MVLQIHSKFSRRTVLGFLVHEIEIGFSSSAELNGYPVFLHPSIQYFLPRFTGSSKTGAPVGEALCGNFAHDFAQ